MKIKLIERANPQDRTKKKVYANPVNAGRKTLHEIALDISGRSSLTRGDVENGLANFVDRLPSYLNDGFSVQLGELATLRLGLTSKGAANEKAFDTESIKPHVIITPGVEFKERMRHISYEREVKKKKPEAARLRFTSRPLRGRENKASLPNLPPEARRTDFTASPR